MTTTPERPQTPLDADELAQISRGARMPRAVRLARTGIPRKFWDVGWDGYRVDRDNSAMVEQLKLFAGMLGVEPRLNGGRGFTLVGPPGIGKTMAACILGVQLSDTGFMIRFMPLADLIRTHIRQITLQQAWQKYEDFGSFEEWKNADENLRTMERVAHLVILDDVGKEHRTASGYAVDEFDYLLRSRVRLGRPVIMTSNVPPTAWETQYSGAMASFVEEATTVIQLQSRTDHRRKEN